MQSLYKLINYYALHYRFPFRGWKYFYRFLKYFGLDKKTYKKKLHNGLLVEVCPADHIQQQIFWYGYYEKSAIELWETLIQPDSVVLDIGANIGYYSLVASAKASSGTVYAFEPGSFLLQKLAQNVKINRISNVHVIPVAISNQTGSAIFYPADLSNLGMSGLRQPSNFCGLQEKVNSIRLDEWAAAIQIDQVDIIKIDVEGAELSALQSMTQVLTTFKPILFVEVIGVLLKRFGDSVEALFQALEEFGYLPYKIEKELTLKKLDRPEENDSVIFIHKSRPIASRIIIS